MQEEEEEEKKEEEECEQGEWDKKKFRSERVAQEVITAPENVSTFAWPLCRVISSRFVEIPVENSDADDEIH